MAAYADVVSLMNTLEQIKINPRLSTSLDKNQLRSLGEKLDFFLDFVERNNPLQTPDGISKEEVQILETRIASAAHAAEDVIESHVFDQMLERSISLLDLQKVIDDMDSIKVMAMEVKEKWGLKEERPTYSVPSTSSRHFITGKNNMVGFDDVLIQLMDVLTRQQSRLQIVSVVGMGGIGKTTLVRNAYESLLIVEHFGVRAWTTVSQDYSVIEILLKSLSSLGISTIGTVDELGERLRKFLYGRKYLVILDDMWSIEVWDRVKVFFPDNGNGSRVVVTTRLSDVATYCGSSFFRMKFLDKDKSWNLFCDKVFGEEDCPPELVYIGKEVVRQCNGLPLSVVVAGGLFQKSFRTKEHWKNVADNIKSVLHSRDHQQVLSLSYNHLPAHLKPCFLYMGIFPEDDEIRVSRLIKLWVAEGFIKPNGAQTVEEIAEGCLKDLIDRNLILVGSHHSNGKIKSCRIHDLVRDLCVRVAEKENFFCELRTRDIPQGIDREHRLVFHDYILNAPMFSPILSALHLTSHARSLICKGIQLPIKCRLLRVLDKAEYMPPGVDARFENFNLRYVAYDLKYVYNHPDKQVLLSSSISLLWNLQTLVINSTSKLIVAPNEIWNMPQLRHIKCGRIFLREPPPSVEQDESTVVLGNLQTLVNVVNFRCSDEVCKRIPNIKKLHIEYDDCSRGYENFWNHSLCNLSRFKLESLKIEFYIPLYYYLNKNLSFPNSLNKLHLLSCGLLPEDLTIIGSLPQLEVLKLEDISLVGYEWSPVEGEFLHLKFLKIDQCDDLRSWNADSCHFPVLQKHFLNLLLLEEIPLGIGEISTLELIRLYHCTESAVFSAVKIKEEQENQGNVGLQIEAKMFIPEIQRLRKRVEREGLTINSSSIRFI